MTENFATTVLGAARIGPGRELKRAVESYWAGRIDADALHTVGFELRRDGLAALAAAGLDSVPVGTFSYYDHMLDMSVLLGALPARVAGIEDELDRYFAAARGNDTVQPLEMTKWFDTNYHYLVPELSASTEFALNPAKILGELEDALAQGIPARPVVIGPITYLLLSKALDGSNLLDRLDDLLPLYVSLLGQLRAAGAQWVQIDEPALVKDLDADQIATVSRVYETLSSAVDRPAILVASYFGRLGEALPALAATEIEGVALDLVAGAVPAVPLNGKLLVAGVVDGRNIWRTDLDNALTTLRSLAGPVAVSTSCSLLHVPYTLAAETGIDDALRGWLAFGAEKLSEVALLSHAVAEGVDSVARPLAAARAALATRATDPRLNNPAVRARLAGLTDSDARRGDDRAAAQAEAIALPVLPMTTIGSFPQTAQIRVARAELRKGLIDEAEYTSRMKREIADVIDLQENLGIDVLVHGEPERNDMVQYFAEQLDGFFATQSGWVQSYGSRCVRPPVLFGDVSRPAPMTVDWAHYAQNLTTKPVKGMLTGPVTILAWAFVRDDQPLAETADQVALAIRDETVDLEAAGIKVIQVDEPALRELLPLRNADKQPYLDWAVRAFRISTSGVADVTSVHTHLCYSEFGEVIDAIVALDADVTSIEAARSHMEVLRDLNEVGFHLGVGPGVYDIHSPRVPSVVEIERLLREALDAVPASRLWVNPDCGLKTRGTTEVEESLRNMVEATLMVRARL
ncbi:5-methyltetrahydropteroyltriglutamate--homocysteine S-methyltransferase [Tomitella biformata]|uniref:5-methyltetrahydropteroyltriglutamate-- homocysteine S-methyltransferase n=1 Tax=Tomitella biformata TaxID=630403 RepID=UPI000464DDB2|nr:5-methyltetrahydropteroyltriglutamate--homocysteine S-methyltransferase [Tomitella biformata]